MTLFRTLVALIALLVCTVAFAETDCTDPVASWKSREQLRQEFEQHGRTAQRIKVDDGCYEVRGLDRRGNKLKAKYSPASLRLRSLEVEFGPTGDASDYLGPAQSVSRGEHANPTSKRNTP
jgi:hypothetical protein